MPANRMVLLKLASKYNKAHREGCIIVFEAADGEEVINITNKHDIHGILLDGEMREGAGGLETIQWLRGKGFSGYISACSACDRLQDRMMERGAHSKTPKPTLYEDFCSFIMQVKGHTRDSKI